MEIINPGWPWTSMTTSTIGYPIATAELFVFNHSTPQRTGVHGLFSAVSLQSALFTVCSKFVAAQTMLRGVVNNSIFCDHNNTLGLLACRAIVLSVLVCLSSSSFITLYKAHAQTAARCTWYHSTRVCIYRVVQKTAQS